MFREQRVRHYRYGLGTIKDAQAYRELERDVRDYIGTLNGVEYDVMHLYYVRGMTTAAIGLRVNYSVSQVNKIRSRVLDRLPD